MTQTAKQIALAHADHASRCATARLWGMKYRASIDPPSAAVGGFPYPARTCAEWDECSPFVPHTEARYSERMKDAIEGSTRLREAILRMAA
jgi:hypothetical protein